VTSLQIIAEYGMIETSGRLLPTPQAHDAKGGKTPEQVATMREKGHGVANLNEVRFGANTAPPSTDGSTSLDGQRPVQPSQDEPDALF
jgi:hypothetical protein